jgi:cytochrome c-type biogenesis protein CcmH
VFRLPRAAGYAAAVPNTILFWSIALALTAAALMFLLPGLLGGRRLSRGRIAGLVVAAALPLAAVALYGYVGSPQAFDEGAADTPPTTGADYVRRLETHLERTPRDARGWVLLARARMQAEQFSPAAQAYARAVDVSPTRVARDPAVLCEYADALAMAQGGRLSGAPAALIDAALAIDPRHPVALEMAGSLAYDEARFADAVRFWGDLLPQLPSGSKRQRELAAAVERARARQTGVPQ